MGSGSISLGGSATKADKRTLRTGFFAFCFGAGRNCFRKSLPAKRLHFVFAAGGPIGGDIIRAFCRRRVANSAVKPAPITLAGRQNLASFCFILFVMGNQRFLTQRSQGTQRRTLAADGRGWTRRTRASVFLNLRSSAFIGVHRRSSAVSFSVGCQGDRLRQGDRNIRL